MIIRNEMTHAINGVEGRMFAATIGGRAKAPGTFCSQTWKASRREGHETMTVELRFDDDCGNGHNSFAITGTLRDSRVKQDGGVVACGCMHDDIAKWFPELAPLIKWHLTATDGPMHYLANTLFHASDRDHNGFAAGEPCAWDYGVRFDGVPITHRVSKSFWQFLKERKETGNGGEFQVFAIAHEDRPGETFKFEPKYSIVGYGATKWHECPFDDQTAADEFCAALNTNRMEFVKVPTRYSEGKKRELAYARDAAVWSDATDEQLCLPREELKALLEARLPGLLVEFRAAMEGAGFMWAPVISGPWYPTRVTRSNAGGSLFAPANADKYESGHVPSHDYAAIGRLCDQLNASGFKRVLPEES